MVLPDEESLSELLHAYKAYFPYDYDKSGMLFGSLYDVDSLIGEKFLFWLANNIRDLTWNIDGIIRESYDYNFCILPNQTGEIIGTASNRMAINANSKNTLNAYNFIKMVLLEDTQSDGGYIVGNIPIRKEAIKTVIYGSNEWDVLYEGQKIMFKGYRSTELSAEELDVLIETFTEVDRFTQPVPYNLYKRMYDTMLPFFKDEKSYDDCFADLKNKLTFYLSE